MPDADQSRLTRRQWLGLASSSTVVAASVSSGFMAGTASAAEPPPFYAGRESRRARL